MQWFEIQQIFYQQPKMLINLKTDIIATILSMFTYAITAK